MRYRIGQKVLVRYHRGWVAAVVMKNMTTGVRVVYKNERGWEVDCIRSREDVTTERRMEANAVQALLA